MRRILSALVLVAVGGVAALALAQARPFRPAPPPRPGARPAPPPADPQACVARRSVLTNEEKRLESIKADMAAADTEMAQLQRRLDELKRQRDDAQRSLPMQSSRVKTMGDMYRRDCQANESCEMYEQQAAALDNQGDGIEAELNAMRTEIEQNQNGIGPLEQRIEPLQREYAQRQCNNLVPGETDQASIDRCSAIFSDWNRLQADLNRQNTRIPTLKSRYQQLATELQNIETRANGYEQYLSRNCSASPETAKMREYPERRRRAQGVGAELDHFVADLTRLRGIKITVAPR